jgi:hypothetical protein
MRIGKYEISDDASFLITGSDYIPISIGAGGDIPDCAIWIKGEPKPYKLPESAFILPCTAKGFYDAVMESLTAD